MGKCLMISRGEFNATTGLRLKDTSKNVIPAKAGIHKLMTSLDSRLRGSDKFGIIRGSLKPLIFWFIIISFGILHYAKVDGGDWKFLQATDEGEFLYDAESITHSAADTVGIWLKIIYSKQYKEREGLSSLSQTVGLWEIDCPNKKVCLLSMSHFPQGEEMSTPNIFLPPEWKSIAPGTIMETLYKTLCK
jgi:Surface-adhesin protein E